MSLSVQTLTAILFRNRYLVITFVSAVVFVNFRALWNWGDAAQLIILIEESVPENLRWLNGIVILDLLYGVVSSFMNVRTFLTVLGITMGVLSQPILLNITETIVAAPFKKQLAVFDTGSGRPFFVLA